MSKPLSWFVVTVLAFIAYIVFTGSVTPYDIVTGLAVSLVVGGLFATVTVENPSKVFNPARWAYLIAYALYYFFIAEVKSHLDVMYRILHPKMPVKPGIVRVPYHVETDYAVTAVANSITNTPGTVVVDIKPEKKTFYVHWINVETTDPYEARKKISLAFEEYAKKVFD